MTIPSTEIRSASQEESSRAIAALVSAFISDPFARYAWSSAHDYLRTAPAFFREFAGASFEHGSAYVPPDFSGAALWLPPEVHPDAAVLEKMLRDTANPEHLGDLLLTFEQMDQTHPQEPHWYLPLIGVDPSAQGRGVGSFLMQHAVKRCDEAGTLAYLESTNPRNISLYKRHGFEVVREIQIGNCPLVTPMMRKPR